MCRVRRLYSGRNRHGTDCAVTEVIGLTEMPKKRSWVIDPAPVLADVPSPRYFAKLDGYCISRNAWQAAGVTTGALPVDPALKRTTPSSVAQKLRTPEML